MPGAYLVGGAAKHCAGLLSQCGLSAWVRWVHSEDLRLLSAPEKGRSAKSVGLTVTRLNGREKTVREREKEKEREEEKSEEERERENRFFYEEKYPELLASMLQTKVVKMGQKQGFEFMEYFNQRGTRKIKEN